MHGSKKGGLVKTIAQRVRGALFGAAFGDALGAPTEFIRDVEQIKRRWPPRGPEQLDAPIARVTDDTQMMLAVGEALSRVERGAAADLAAALRAAFITWYHDPENNRAPGGTCLRACQALQDAGVSWQHATVPGSKGCGANMRVQPLGLLPGRVSNDDVAGMAQLQAAMTHGHPTGVAAADATAMALRLLLTGVSADELVDRLVDYARSQRDVYRTAWLGELWRITQHESPEHYIARGWDEVLEVLGALRAALEDPRHDQDPCIATGDAWIAEEALATGLHAFLLYPDSPIDALRRAATTRGDSDSIACLTGAFAGAYLGEQAWPDEWFERIEYADELERIAQVCLSWGQRPG